MSLVNRLLIKKRRNIMIVTLLGVGITVFMILVIKEAVEYGAYKEEAIKDEQIVPIIFLVVGISMIVISFFNATKYHDAKLIEEVEVSSYCYSSGDYTFQYWELGNPEIEEGAILLREIEAKQKDVNVMERKDITVPTLKRYEMKGKISIWTLGIFDKKEVYELYVLRGTFSNSENW